MTDLRIGPWHTVLQSPRHAVTFAARALQEPERLDADALHAACRAMDTAVRQVPRPLPRLGEDDDGRLALIRDALDVRDVALRILDARAASCPGPAV